jgi:alkylhydroperoxidase family enzyme
MARFFYCCLHEPCLARGKENLNAGTTADHIAIARSRDVPLPAVELVQIGDCYFVRDDHHRISVAKLSGQVEIEAEVTVWQGLAPERAAPTSQSEGCRGQRTAALAGAAKLWAHGQLRVPQTNSQFYQLGEQYYESLFTS